MNNGDTISINLDAVITSNGSLLSAWIGGEVVATTEKAVKLMAVTENGKEVTCWFPRKALKAMGNAKIIPGTNSAHACFTLARWFKFDGWAATFAHLTRDVQVLAG